MAKTIYIDRLLRLTLTRRGKAVAKHPLLREGAVEAIKAMSSQIETTPLRTTCKATQDEDELSALTRYQSGRWS